MTYKLDDLIGKITCADCLDVLRDLPDKCVDLVLTDPPYGGVNRETNGLRNLDKGCADIVAFDFNAWLNEIVRICKGSVYIWCGHEQISDIFKKLNTNKFSTRLLIWEKTNPSPMNGDCIWLSGIEPCVYGKRGGQHIMDFAKIPLLEQIQKEKLFTQPKSPSTCFQNLLQQVQMKTTLFLIAFRGLAQQPSRVIIYTGGLSVLNVIGNIAKHL